jgi:stearoyl-CoA desaturase (delta-9 desaturase)
MAGQHGGNCVNTVIETPDCSAAAGNVQWDPVHSLWNGGMLVASLVLAPLLFSWSAFVVFLVLTGATILLGHSVGFHRLLIHRSFACPTGVEHMLVWIGTIVGLSGPLWMIRTHDLRDWAQRQPACHDYLAHRQPLLVDAWWQLHCTLVLKRPPIFDLGDAGRNRFYRLLEASWMLQQLPIAVLLFALGGWGWVIWGVCVRVCVSVTGHWFVGHLAHRRGPQSWLVDGAGVQAHDVPWAALPTMGEAWHNNHHAFPGSARIGLYPGQSDWGYAVIRWLERCGLASDVILPADLPLRHNLRPVPANKRTPVHPQPQAA